MGKNDSILLHPKYGLNPTMPLCFYCGKEKGEIALLGNYYKGEAPRTMLLDILPCDECQVKYEDYTLLVEVVPKRKIQIPTGRWCAIKKEVLDLFDPPKMLAYVSTETMDYLINQMPKEEIETNE